MYITININEIRIWILSHWDIFCSEIGFRMLSLFSNVIFTELRIQLRILFSWCFRWMKCYPIQVVDNFNGRLMSLPMIPCVFYFLPNRSNYKFSELNYNTFAWVYKIAHIIKRTNRQTSVVYINDIAILTKVKCIEVIIPRRCYR